MEEKVTLDGRTPILLYFGAERPMNTREYAAFCRDYGLRPNEWTLASPYGDAKYYLDEIRREAARRFPHWDYHLAAYVLIPGERIA